MLGSTVSVILASGSPRRADLLRPFDLPLTIIPSEIDEDIFNDVADLDERVRLLARAKALAIASAHPHSVIIGADTLVDLHGQALGKPSDREHAMQMLRQLSGNPHQVRTGVAVLLPEGQLWRPPTAIHRCLAALITADEVEFDPLTGAAVRRTVVQTSAASTVQFRSLTEQECNDYLASGEPIGKAGAYAIQGIGGNLVAAMTGCYPNVIGLPICQLLYILRCVGVWRGVMHPVTQCTPREQALCNAL